MLNFKSSYCIIRRDLEEAKLSIPIEYKGKTLFIHGASRGWRYRWINQGNDLQIYYGRTWCNADSIDFDFITVGNNDPIKLSMFAEQKIKG